MLTDTLFFAGQFLTPLAIAVSAAIRYRRAICPRPFPWTSLFVCLLCPIPFYLAIGLLPQPYVVVDENMMWVLIGAFGSLGMLPIAGAAIVAFPAAAISYFATPKPTLR